MKVSSADACQFCFSEREKGVGSRRRHDTNVLTKPIGDLALINLHPQTSIAIEG